MPPKRLLRGLLPQVLFTVRSERALVELIGFNLLYRWFAGLGLQDPVRDRQLIPRLKGTILSILLIDLENCHVLGRMLHSDTYDSLSECPASHPGNENAPRRRTSSVLVFYQTLFSSERARVSVEGWVRHCETSLYLEPRTTVVRIADAANRRFPGPPFGKYRAILTMSRR
jgi:hypothetical protein